MGDRQWADTPYRYVTATEIDSAFYPPWDGKMHAWFDCLCLKKLTFAFFRLLFLVRFVENDT